MGLLKGRYEFEIGGSVLLSDYTTLLGRFCFSLLASVHTQLAEAAFGLGILVFSVMLSVSINVVLMHLASRFSVLRNPNST